MDVTIEDSETSKIKPTPVPNWEKFGGSQAPTIPEGRCVTIYISAPHLDFHILLQGALYFSPDLNNYFFIPSRRGGSNLAFCVLKFLHENGEVLEGDS